MYWILVILFANGDTGAAVLSQPMPQQVCQQMADEVVKETKELSAMRCVRRLEDVQ